MNAFQNISKEAQLKAAIQFVIVDAIEKGHTNKDELTAYMQSATFEAAVASYISLMNA